MIEYDDEYELNGSAEYATLPAEPVTRLTVSLPISLVKAMDRLLAKDSNRSAAVREALQRAVDAARRREEVERFVRGYEAEPQSVEEFGWADAAAVDFWKGQEAT
jgi:Arc/MetJ-type ribon-helix-helix transcriptional regulator